MCSTLNPRSRLNQAVANLATSEQRLRNRCKKKVRSRSHPKLGRDGLSPLVPMLREIDVPYPFAPGARGDRGFQGVLFLTFLLTRHLRFWQKSFGVRLLLRAGQNESIP
jgi:hypothetical protein